MRLCSVLPLFAGVGDVIRRERLSDPYAGLSVEEMTTVASSFSRLGFCTRIPGDRHSTSFAKLWNALQKQLLRRWLLPALQSNR